MPILADCHLHSHNSGDSDASMEEMILRGIQLGLQTICFTEHNDFAYPVTGDEPEDLFELNADSYLYELLCFREKYASRIRILFGLELGLQTCVAAKNAAFAHAHDYDFIIGSSHVCNGKDPYYPSFFEGRSDEEAYREYFQCELENARSFDDFDVYGHLDYVVRYGAAKDADYSYDKYKDLLDTILETLLEKGKGIELNTAGLSKGLRDFHPCMDVLKRYRKLGGEIITIGSDAHDPGQMGSHFKKAAEVLTACGFQYYTVFEKRRPERIKL